MISLKTKLLLENISASKTKINYFIVQWAGSLADTKLTKEQIHKMLDNVADIKTLKMISDYFYETDGKIYIAYQPADDDFLKDDKRDNIINKLSEYIYKYISNTIKQ